MTKRLVGVIKLKKMAVIIMILTIGSKFFGFLRDITLSYFYGASNISDAFLVSQSIPMSFLEFLGLGLLAGYIPIYNTIETKQGMEKSNAFTNKIASLVLLISTVLVLLGLVFTESIVKIFAMGFEGETLELAVVFTRVSIFGIYFISIGYVFIGYLQVKSKFIIPTLIGYPLNVVMIISIAVSFWTNNIFLAVGSLLAAFSQLFILIPFSYKEGFRFKFTMDFKDDYVKQLFRLSAPMVIGISVNQFNILVDKTLASQIVEGGISALNYASRLNSFVQGIFVLSITTVMYPMISKMVANEDMKGLRQTLLEAIGGTSILIIPVTIGASIFSEYIVTLLFGRGAFSHEAILMTSTALAFYSIGMIGFGLREVLSRAFYSLKDTKTPMINASIGMILNIILSKYLGIGGLALATSITAIFTTALLFISLRKKIGPFGMKQISISFLKVLLASLIMGGLAKLSFNYLTVFLSQNFSLVLAIGVGAISYFVMIYFMKIEDVDIIVREIKKKLGRGAA
jgi:putative peptidoglycan lipid II flippase